MKFFLDANLPYSALMVFEDLEFEAIHARDVGMKSATDLEIFDYVERNNYILVTKDLEFGNKNLFRLDKLNGLIILRFPYFFKTSQICDQLKDFLNSINVNDLENSMIIVKLGRFRIKKIK